MNLMAALQMRTILAAQGISFSLRQITSINLVTSFYGLFLPTYLAGGLIRWHHFSRPDGKRAQALAAMVLSREVELLTTLGYGIVFYAMAVSSSQARPALITLAITLAAAVTIVMTTVSPVQHRIVRSILTRLRLPLGVITPALKVSKCLADFGRHGRRHHLSVLTLCIARNALGVTSFVYFARALHIGASVPDLGWIRAVLDGVLTLPISIAGLGVRDASLVTLLTGLGVASSAALALSLVLLARTLLLALCGGLVEGLRIYYGVAPGFANLRATASADRWHRE
jgi:hypothetical protein